MTFKFLGVKPPSDRFCELHKNTYCLDKACFVSNEEHFRGALLEAAEVSEIMVSAYTDDQKIELLENKFHISINQAHFKLSSMLRVSAGENE